MRRIWIVGVMLAVLMGVLWYAVFHYHEGRKEAILRAWTDLEMQIVREAARATKAWLQMRIEQQGVSKDQAEQEVFKKFIEPILLLKNGDAWIYNRRYVIFDKSSDFPDIYRGKTIRQIFEMQKEKGAHHYEDLCFGVMNATEGKGWYVWLPEKGREFVAWTSVRLLDDTWTIGLSTPEPEILNHSGFDVGFQRELGASVIITFLFALLFYLVLQQYRRDQGVMRRLQQTAHEVSEANRQMELQLAEIKRVEQALRESEEKYRTLIENIQDGIFIIQDSKIRYVNEAFANMIGYTVDEVLEVDFTQLVAPEDLPMVSERYRLRQQGEEVPPEYEFHMMHRNGTRVVVNMNVGLITYLGQIASMGTVKDITRRKEAEVALRMLAHELSALNMVAEQISGSLSLEVVVQTALDQMVANVTPDLAMLFLRQGDLLIPQGLAPKNTPFDHEPLPVHKVGECLCGLAAVQKKPVYSRNAPDDPRCTWNECRKAGFRSFAALPLLNRNEVIGVLGIASVKERDFADQADFLEALGNQVALGLNNSLLYQQVNDHASQLEQQLAERRQMELALRSSEERFRSAFSSAALGMALVAPEGRFLEVNPFLCQMLGYSEEELLSKSVKDVTHPEDLDLDLERHRQLLEDRAPFVWLDKRYLHKNGQAVWGRVSRSLLRDPEGKPLRLIAHVQDIGELKQAEEALRESEEQYRLVVDNANDAIFIAQDGVLKFSNPRTLSITGYSQEELGALSLADLIHPEDLDLVLDWHGEELDGEGPFGTYSFRMLNKTGAILWVQLSTVLIVWKGRPATLNFLRDITVQKRLEDQYQHAQKMEAIGTLAGGIAHDFNNLLQAVQGYTEFLLFDRMEEDWGYQELHEIRRAARRGGELTQQLLTFSRKVESKLRPVDLNHEVEKISKLLGRTLPKMISIDLNLEGRLWSVNADPLQMEQILMNLALNAKDALPDGGRLTIETKNVTLDEVYHRAHSEVAPGDYVLLTVADTGSGMDPKTLDHIFDPFYTTKEVGQGTGLGLPMVYGIVKNHRGHISCHSELERGTMFSIYLPAIKGAEEAQTSAGSSPEKFKRGTETILLVDDDKFLIRLGEQNLKRFGYNVVTAYDGETALELYEEDEQNIDLVVLDLIMPGMGGNKCLQKILEMDPGARVIIASGFSADGRVQDALENGARAFINKPYEVKEMLEVIRSVLDRGTDLRDPIDK